MTTIEPTRFADGPAMLLAGIRRRHSFADAPRDIPLQWQEFIALGELPGQRGTKMFGAVCGNDTAAQTIEYMCAAEVADFANVPTSLGRMRVPAQHYAVFSHRGPVSGIRATWDAIWNDWLPRSGFEPADTPDFELYDERYDPATASGVIEIWFPVKR